MNFQNPFNSCTKTARDFKKMQLEILVLVKGHDETYAQIVHSNSSYIWNEIEWNVSFKKIHYPEDGTTILDLNKLNETTKTK